MGVKERKTKGARDKSKSLVNTSVIRWFSQLSRIFTIEHQFGLRKNVYIHVGDNGENSTDKFPNH